MLTVCGEGPAADGVVVRVGAGVAAVGRGMSLAVVMRGKLTAAYG